MLKSLFFILHNRSAVKKVVGKLSEIKLVTSLLVSSRNLVNLELFWFQWEWLRKMKTIALCPQSIRAFVQNTLPKTASNKIFWYVVLMGPYFKLRKSVLKKDAVQLIFNFPMESCKRAIGQKATKMSK